MTIADRHARLVRVNPAFADMLGHTAGELVGKHLAELAYPEDAAASAARHASLWDEGVTFYSTEKRYQHRDGGVVWASVQVNAVPGPEGQPVCAIAQVENITARKEWSEQLARRGAILEAVFASAASLLELPSWEAAMDKVLARLGRAADVSRVHLFELLEDGHAVRQRFEWTAAGVGPKLGDPALSALDLEHPATAGWLRELAAGRPVQAHTRTVPEPIRSLLRSREVQSAVAVPVFADGALWGIFGLDECSRERTFTPPEVGALRAAAVALGSAIERQLAEASRREAEERYRMLVETLPLTTYIGRADETASAIYISPQIEGVLGYPAQAWLDDPAFFERVLHPEDRTRSRRSGWPDEENPHADEYRLVAKDGRTVWIHDEFYVATGSDGQRTTRGFVIDITERKQMEEALRQTNETLRALVDAAPVAIIASDPELRSRRGTGRLSGSSAGRPLRSWDGRCRSSRPASRQSWR
jgi:PAS domain S-box-containing protein